MLNDDCERELAYIVRIDDITPIEGADNVELAHMKGWTIMVRKNQFHKDDLAVYFEIDSKVPEKEPFLFLESKHYCITTQKYFKGKVISQGLLMSAADFGWKVDYDFDTLKPMKINNLPEGSFVTELLGVTYASADDIQRKKSFNKYDEFKRRHKKIMSNRLMQKLYQNEICRSVIYNLFTPKKQRKNNWPYWVKKTDEERIQNIPYVLKNKEPLIVTEKID